MFKKLQRIFENECQKHHGLVVDNEHFDELIKKLMFRKLVIEHDIPILKKYIIEYPFNFNQFISYLRQIFKLEIEHKIIRKFNSMTLLFQRVTQFINLYDINKLNNEDVYDLMKSLNTSLGHCNDTLTSINQIDFLLKNIRDEIQKFLWEPILLNIDRQTEKNNPDFFFEDSKDYQHKMLAKIEYEYEIIRTKKVYYGSERKVFKKIKNQIIVEKMTCADRDIPLETWKIPNNFFDSEILAKFFYKCEASRELLLSKYFQKFAGFDDTSFEEYQLYFFENLEGIDLETLLTIRNLDISENSMLFKYLSKEILHCLRDLLYKSNFAFSFPLKLSNFSYHLDQQRLFIHDVDFLGQRKAVLDSHNIIESKLLFYFAMIVLELFALKNPEFKELLKEINYICQDFNEFEKMQKIFDIIITIEEKLVGMLDNDIIISIIIECLISPYKAKIVFDKFYEKKNFFNEIFEKPESKKGVPKKNEKAIEKNYSENPDKFVVFEPYYELKNITFKNEALPERIMNLNLLLIHPFFENTNFDSNYIAYIFKDSNK